MIPDIYETSHLNKKNPRKEDQLSRGILLKILNQGPTNAVHCDIIMQILDVQLINSTGAPFIDISDGMHSVKISLMNDVVDKLEHTTLRSNDIVDCKILLHQSMNFVLMDFKIIYKNIIKKLGNPTEVFEYAQILAENGLNVSHPNTTNFLNSDTETTNTTKMKLTDISELTTQTPTDFTIMGTVISKDKLKTFHKKTGGLGHVFSIQVIDDSKTPKNIIKCLFYNDLAVNFNNLIEIEYVYSFQGGEVKTKNTKFNHTKHDYEINFNSSTKITTHTDSKKLQPHSEVFELLSIVDSNISEEVDIMVIVQCISEPTPTELVRPADSQQVEYQLTLNKRAYRIYDESGYVVDLRLYGDDIKGLD